MTKSPFAPGRRWLATRPGKARLYFIVLGPGPSYAGEPSTRHKMCRVEPHPEDRGLPGGGDEPIEQTYSHAHLKKHAVLVPEENELLGTTPSGGQVIYRTRPDGIPVRIVVTARDSG